MRNYLAYDNFLAKIDKSSASLEKAMAKHRLNFPSLRDREVECHRFTPFVFEYYELVAQCGWPPYQSEFVDSYIKKHMSEFKDLYARKGDYIRARLKRCHPSYARDLHFGLLCRESGLFDDVIYNCELDVRQGIDLLIIKDAKFYGIHNFVDTAKANEWRSKKDNRHSDKNQFMTEIDFTVFKKDGKPCGDYFLFGAEQVKKLDAAIVAASK